MTQKQKFILLVSGALVFALLGGIYAKLSAEPPQVIVVEKKGDSQPKLGETFALQTITTDPLDLDDDREWGANSRTGTTTQAIETTNDSNNLTYLDAGTTATTSLVLHSELATAIDANLFIVASSTSSRLHICREFSTNGIDWYGEINLTDNSNEESTFGVRCFEWTAAHTATTTINLPASPTLSTFTKFNFRNTGADLGLWVEAVLKQNAN